MNTNIEVKQGSGINIFLVLLVLIGFVFAGIYYDKAKQQEKKTELISQSFKNHSDSLEYELIKLNDSVKVYSAKTKALYMDKETLEKLYFSEVENAKKLNIRLKDILSLQNIESQTIDTVYSPVYVDSIQRLCTKFNDNFVNIETCIPRIGNAEIIYNIKEKLLVTEYYEPKRIL